MLPVRSFGPGDLYVRVGDLLRNKEVKGKFAKWRSLPKAVSLVTNGS